jgi:cysteine desulfurase family protein (TIGR01976 family)
MVKNSSTLKAAKFRKLFPALQQKVNGRPAAYLDGPGGTQVPQSVIEAMGSYLANGLSNTGGPFHSSRVTDETKKAARQAMVDFYNARRPEEIVFGQNMTSLTFSMSRALARTWQAGDEIVVTRIDHDANISPWLLAAKDRGVTVRWLDFRPEDCTLALETLPELLSEKTRLVAVNYASNAVGSISDVKRATTMAHEAEALVYVDAVHYAPHDVIDVQALDCDFLASSTYKYFGPHTGILYGKYEHLERLAAYKVRPSSNKPPGKWETGTQSFESLAGVTAAVDYIASLTDSEGTRRERLVAAMSAVKAYEVELSAYFLQEATKVKGLRVYGITDVEMLEQRTPTFAVSLAGHSAESVAAYLGERGIYVWHGHFYALAVMERLGLLESGGLVRIGFVHYNTKEEVDRVLQALREYS